MPTAIEWCDETFNPWWGCAEVSPGCGNCYARTWAAFTRGSLNLWPAKGPAGKGQTHAVMVTGEANWRKPLKWARELPEQLGRRPRIFCASMADVFEPLPELDKPRRRLFRLIAATPELDWLVLTKRPDYARTWLQWWFDHYWYEVDHGKRPEPLPWTSRDDTRWGVHPNIWIGTSIENARYTWRADMLREIPAAVRFISAEPLLGSLFDPRRHVDEHGFLSCDGCQRMAPPDQIASFGCGMPDACALRERHPLDLSGIDWVIIGGESGPGARPFHLEHAREIIGAATVESYERTNYAEDNAVAVFVKQLGAHPICEHVRTGGPFGPGVELKLSDRKHGGDMAEWPEDLRIREFPRTAVPE